MHQEFFSLPANRFSDWPPLSGCSLIQACMVTPTAAKPLPWDSKDLAALVALVEQERKAFKPVKH